MAAPRLSDAQKQDLVDRFRSGAGTQELAAAYGCSPNTVIRVVKAAIEPSQYEELKRQRGRRAASGCGDSPALAVSDPAPTAASPDRLVGTESAPAAPAAEPAQPAAGPSGEPAADDAEEACEAPEQPEALSDAARSDDEPDADASDDSDASEARRPPADEAEHEAARGLAIDDADDFDAVDPDDDGDEPEDDDPGAAYAQDTFVEVPVSFSAMLEQPLTTARPWRRDELPSSAYMLVDKTVELQARPLSEIPELGRLEAEELELQALVLYSNPRQAKRHCGRTQRVIPVPDVGVIERRATYLVRQGIRRVVVEGALYALPGA